MAAKEVDTLAAASLLLKQGKVTEADQMLVRLQQAATKAAAAGAAAEPPPPPRTVPEVTLDLFKALTGLLGSHPSLTPLLNELEALITEVPSATAANS